MIIKEVMQLRKERLEKFRLADIWTLASAIPVQRSNQLYIELANQMGDGHLIGL